MRYGDISYFQSGVAVPLFSLYSKQSIGIGEYLDLIPFARWALFCDFNIIQLLPVFSSPQSICTPVGMISSTRNPGLLSGHTSNSRAST